MFRFIIVFLFILFSGNLFALDTDFTVTGSRVPLDSYNQAGNILIIEEDEMSSFNSLSQLFEQLSFFRVVSLGGNRSYASMGGFGENGFGRLLIMYDGVILNTPDSNGINLSGIPIESIQRIEIFFGATSAIYGDQAVAGVLNIIPKKTQGFSYTVFSGLNDYMSNTQGGSVSYRSEDFGISSFVKRDQFLAQRENSNSYSLDANVLVDKAFGGVYLDGGASFHQFERDIPGGILESDFLNNPDKSDNESDTASGFNLTPALKFQFNAGPLFIQLPVSYRYSHNIMNIASLSSFIRRDVGSLDAKLTASYFLFDDNEHGASVVGGIDVINTELKQYRFTDSGLGTQQALNSLTRTNFAPWARFKYSLGDYLYLDVGGRLEQCSLYASGDDANGEISFSPLVFSGAVSYFPQEDLKLYISGGQLFRYPFFDEQVDYSPAGLGVNSNLNFEKGLSFTSGVDYKAENFVIRFNAYSTLMEDEITLKDAVYVNLNQSAHTGGDLYFEFDIDVVNIELGYGYVNAIFMNGDNINKQLPLIPNHKVTGSLNFSLPAGFSFYSDFLYTSGYFAKNDEQNIGSMISPRLNINASLSWKFWDEHQLILSVENITDDRTPTNADFDGSDLTYYPMEGRKLKLEVKW